MRSINWRACLTTGKTNSDLTFLESVSVINAHLSEIAEDVRVGTRVKAGDEIGAVGATGLVSGPNLHYEVRVDGRPVDPKDQDALPEQEIATAADLDALATWRSETGFMPTTDGERG